MLKVISEDETRPSGTPHCVTVSDVDGFVMGKLGFTEILIALTALNGYRTLVQL